MLSLDSHYKPLYVYKETQTRHKELTYKQIGKRVFDILFALLVIILVLSWMIPIIGLLIRLSSAGPVLYIQKRTGFRGKPFNCLKFRTMLHNPNGNFRQATKFDDRITTIGRFLRKTNLDEMPQFLNVLLGDMSIVGPRPHALQHSAQFWNTFPDYKRRYKVKPGVTGLAQVRGARGETETLLKMQHRVKYDLFYKEKYSFWLDILICWWTIKSMVKGNINAW